MLKTGIAVTLTIYVTSLLQVTSPVIAAVAAIFAMQPTIYRSWKHFLDQLQTNTLGAVLAMIAGTYFSKDPFAVGIVCVIVIMLCLKLKMEETIGLTLVTVIAVMDASGQWQFALNRFMQILIGIGIASLINIFFLPPRPRDHFIAQIEAVFVKLSLLLRTVISNELRESIFRDEKRELKDALDALSAKFKLLEEEYKKLRGAKLSSIRDLVVYSHMLAALRKGFDVLETVDQHYFQGDRDEWTDAQFDRQLERLIKLHEHVLLRFDEKLKKSDRSETERIEEECQTFMREVLNWSGKRADADLRLTIVSASLFDYGHQIGRLDKLVEQYHKGETSKAEARQ